MNKKISGLILFSFVGLFAFTIAESVSAQNAVPTCNSATLNGYVITNGATTNAQFEWGPGTSIQWSTPVQVFSNDSDYHQLIDNLTENTTYSFRTFVSNENGTHRSGTLSFTTASCQQAPQQQRPTVTLTADSASVPMNGATTLRWSSTNADSCNASGGSFNWFGAKNLSGSQSTGVLTNTTTYSMTCYNSAGSDSKSVTVNVQPQQQEAQRCTDTSATNYNQVGACTYAQRCNDTSATNYNQVGACTYAQRCNDTSATNYNQVGACTYAQRCNDTSATNYNSVGACRYSNVRPTVDLRADDTSINYNSSTVVRWTSTNANTCSSSGGTNGWSSGNRGTNSSFSTGNLTNTVTYNITCSNNFGSDSDSVTINVSGQNNNNNNQNVNVDISADDTSINYNSNTFVRWNSTNANNCTASGGTNGWSTGNRGTSGSFPTGALTNAVTYTITCYNNGNSDSDSVTVNVSGSSSFTIGEPTVFLTADQFNVGINGSTVVRWTSNNANTCFASGGTPNWPGTRGTSGSFNTGLLTRTTTFYISCSNSVGSGFDSVTIVAQGQPVFIQTTNNAYVPPASQISLLSLASAADVVGCACDNFASGSDILYTLTYQNNSGSTARNVTLRITLPPETTFVSSAPHNSNMSGNNLTFNVGNVLPNSQGAVMVRLRSRDGMTNGGNVNFYAVADHTNASGQRLSINDSISAQLPNSYAYAPNNNTNTENRFQTAASAATAGVASALTSGAVGWLLLVVLVLLIIILVKHLLTQNQKRTIITTTTP